MPIRVACYIDGFNVYHAIDDQNRLQNGAINHLKWLNVRALMECFCDPNVHSVISVKFFTAYPHWNSAKEDRHKAYVQAIEHFGATAIIGRFKEKECFCKRCRRTYTAREEKESDVNLGAHLINDAHLDVYDQAFLVTNDSDLLGPVRMFRAAFPDKRLKIISPPFRKHSKELWGAATHRATVGQLHLAASLMPEVILSGDGVEIVRRPANYAPPA